MDIVALYSGDRQRNADRFVIRRQLCLVVLTFSFYFDLNKTRKVVLQNG